METYYARRAAEYEKIYQKPERQADLARLRRDIPALFRGERVLEIACGTAYWTPLIAELAGSVLAVDYNDETLAIARTKEYPKRNVRFRRADAYALPDFEETFSSSFAGFWWSHVPVSKLAAFIRGLHARLQPGARVAFLDNRYVEGSSTAISRTDAEGNTYQCRRLADGSAHEVLKNFPTGPQLRERLAPFGTEVAFQQYEYYWLVTYRIMAATYPGGKP